MNTVHSQALINSLFSKQMGTSSSYAQRSLHWMIRDNPLTIPSPTVFRAQTSRRGRCLIVCPICHISSCEGEGLIIELRCLVFLLKSFSYSPSVITPDRPIIHLFAPIFAFNEFLCQLVPQFNYSLCDRVFL